MNSKKHFFHKYELLSTNNIPSIVGLGANSAVQLAVNKETEKLVAVKKIHRKLAIKESSIHSQLSHPNIVNFVQAFFDTETNSSFVVLEYIPNGTLSECIIQNPTLNKQEICKIFIGICKGLQAIHQKQIIHRDIKPANILFDQCWNAKICDFGNAINKPKTNQVCGTLEYMAPQIISQNQYDCKVDVWAVGVMLYQVLEGKLPFCYKNVTNLLESIKQPLQFSRNVRPNFREIIQKMLSLNPQERPSASKVIQYLQKIRLSVKFGENSQRKYEVKRQRLKTHYQSQNSTADQLDFDFADRLIIKKDNSAAQLKGVISLRTFRPIIQQKKIPNIKIHKPLNRSCTAQISQPTTSQPFDGKLSITQALKNYPSRRHQ